MWTVMKVPASSWVPIAQWSTVVSGLGALGVLAVTTFWIPFTGDQALFAIAGEQLLSGSVLYRDFWDIKQPGIFWWYALAILLPGSDLFGVRLLEVLWQSATAALLVIIAASFTNQWWLRLATPVLVFGPYLATGGQTGWGLALIEPLVGLPMLLMIAFTARAGSAYSRGRLIASGICVGVVVVLKALYALVALPVLVATLLALRSDHEKNPGHQRLRVFRALAWAALGATVPVGITAAQALSTGSLSHLAEVTFVQPLQISQLDGFEDLDASNLITAALGTYGWTVPFVVAALFQPRASRRWLVAPMLVWAGAATLTMAVQPPNAYQVYALLVPLGLIAAMGLERLSQWASTRSMSGLVAAATALVLSVVAALPIARSGTHIPSLIAGRAPAMSQADRTEIARAINSEYGQVSRAAATLPTSLRSIHDPIYVFGSPLWYTILDRRQAVEISGWSPQFLTPALWSELERELYRSRPKAIFVDEYSRPLITEYGSGIERLLRREYEQVWVIPGDGDGDAGAGIWWITPRPGDPAPSREGMLAGE